MELKKGITKNVVALGVVSFFTDISSEMLYPILPLFLTTVLNAPMTVVGLIEGIAEMTASLLKAAGGYWSDRQTRRKPFVDWGYGLSALSKPLMALAGGWPFVLFLRFIDRAGKGLRTSARDALIASSCESKYWGKAFGLHRAMDTAGAVLGPLAALWILNGLGLGYRHVFVAAFIPALLGMLALIFFVKETSAAKAPGAGPAPARAGKLPKDFYILLACYGVFALGNSSDVFLLLKARQTGFSAGGIIMAYVMYNTVYALAAAPAGCLSDRLGRTKTMTAGLLIFAGVYLGFGAAPGKSSIWILFALYGLYGAFSEGIAKAAIADHSGPENRATAMGIFQGSMGLLALAANLAAGFLWSHVSPAAPFILGAACAVISAILMLVFLHRTGDTPQKQIQIIA